MCTRMDGCLLKNNVQIRNGKQHYLTFAFTQISKNVKDLVYCYSCNTNVARRFVCLIGEHIAAKYLRCPNIYNIYVAK